MIKNAARDIALKGKMKKLSEGVKGVEGVSSTRLTALGKIQHFGAEHERWQEKEKEWGQVDQKSLERKKSIVIIKANRK